MRKLFILLFFTGIGIITAQAQETSCSDGVDNDGDGFIDCFDSDCGGNVVCKGTYIGNDTDCEIPQPPGSNFAMVLENESNEHVSSTHGRFVIGDMGHPVTGKDGIPEIVTAHTSDRKIYILDGQTLDIKHQATSPNRIDRYDIAIADVRNNGCASIFVAEVGTERVCTRFRSNGSCRDWEDVTKHYVSSWDCQANFLWRQEVHDRPFTLALADFDGDGKAELYFRNQILDAATGQVHIAGSGDWATIDGGPVAVDILDDSECADCAGLELVAGGQIYSVGLNAPGSIDGGTLTLVRQFNNIPGLSNANKWQTKSLDLDGDEFVNSQTSIADYDLDGFLDVLMTGTSNSGKTTIFYWNVKKNTGDVYRPSNNWKYGAGRLNLADLDGDGQMNVAFVSGSYLYALDENLDFMWRIGIDEETSGYTSTTVFDFNNDGASEIVYRDETYLYIIKGDGTFSPPINCKSLTSNDYPIVADVDADGSTEICVICQDNFNDSNYAGANEGVIRTYTSANEPWVSSRKVWNQHGYFNVNVNDDLTIPQVQQKHHMVFSEDVCGTGENRVLNSFLNQSAILNTDGCKTYPSADISFVANPNLLNITPPTCPDLAFHVSFTIRNSGSLDVTADIPITFYNGDPRLPNATKLGTQIIPIGTLEQGDQLVVPDLTVSGIGTAFTLYAVLNDNGTSVPTPIVMPNSGIEECNLGNNIASAAVNPQVFQLSTSSADHVQCGAGPSPPNGSVRAFKLEGAVEQTVGYTFHWFDGSVAGAPGSADHTGSQVTGLPGGTYSVYALHNAYQCGSDTVQVVVGQQALSISATVNVDQPYTNCNDPDGQLSVTPDGGDPGDYTYEWFEGTVFGTSPQLSDSSVLRFTKALTYSVLVTQISSGCETLESGTVPDMTVTPTVTTAVTAANCAPPNSGQASAHVGGVTAGYTFYWYDGATSKPTEDFLGHTYPGVTAGNYTVIARDNTTGCSSNETVATVPTVTGITVSADITAQQTSCALPNGAASASVNNSTAGYSFRWFEGNNTINQIGTDPQIAGLEAGDYTVQATNLATGCTDTELITIVDIIQIPTVTPSVLAHQVDCFPPDGSVGATAAGSPGPYQFYWFDGNVGTPDTTTADFKGANYPGLIAGSYTVVAVDASTRCASPRGLVQVLNQTIIPAIESDTVNQTSCDLGAPNGQASATVGGVTAGYKFRWFSGADTTNFLLQNAVLTNRAAGTYTVKAINLATGCFATKLVVINDVSAKPTLSLTKQDNTTCSETIGYTGSVSAAFATNLNALPGHTFTYEWKRDGVVMTGENDPLISGLDAATYEVTVRNEALECVSDPISIVVNDVADLPAITTAFTGSTNCSGPGNGTVTVTGVVPADAYEYRWYAGNAVGATGAELNAINNPTAIGLQGGAGQNYTVEVTLVSSGCKNTVTVLLPDESVLPVLGPLSKTDNTFCVGADGTASIGTVTYQGNPVANPYAGYTLAWSNGDNTPTTTTPLAAGSYTLTITKDDVNCTSDPVSVTINNNLTLPAITAVPTGSTNCAAPAPDNGRIDVTGVLPNNAHTYRWLDPSNAVMAAFTGNFATGLAGGSTYTVEVTYDVTGCSNTQAVLVPDESVLPVLGPLSKTDNTFCVGADGTASIGTVTYQGNPVANPYAGYTLSWSNGDNTPTTTTPLAAGSYTLTITKDDVNCTSDPVSVTINDNLTLPAITAVPTGSTNCAAPAPDNGRIDVTGVLPNNAHTYRWLDPSNAVMAAFTGNFATGLAGGSTYTVEVTYDVTGCSNTQAVLVPDESVLPVLGPLSKTDNTFCVGADGTASIGTVTYQGNPVANPYAGYTLAWSNGDNTPTTTTPLAAGSYTLTITKDDVNCTSDPVSVTINNNLTLPAITAVPTGSTNCAAPAPDNGRIDVTGVLPNNAHTYRWLDPSNAVMAAFTGNFATGLAGGSTYTVEVTYDVTGCSNTQAVLVPDESVLPVLGPLSKTDNTFCVGADGTASIGTVTYQGNPVSNPYAGYTLSWSNGDNTPTTTTPLAAGNYTLTITKDDVNCTSDPVSVTINDNLTLPAITAVPTGSTNCAAPAPDNGRIDVTGVLPNNAHTYRWLDPSNAVMAAFTGNFATGLAGGSTYTVEVTYDVTGCSSTQAVLVPDESVLPVLGPLSKTDNTFCVGADGTASIGTVTYQGNPVANPYAGYTLAWSNGDNTPTTTTPLAAGAYTLTITKDDVNCTSDPVSVTINDNLTLPAILLTATPQTSCDPTNLNGQVDAAVDVSGVPTTAGYTFSWFNGSDTSTPLNPANVDGTNPFIAIDLAGNVFYTSQVVNVTTQCQNTSTVFVEEFISIPRIEVTVTDIVDCNTPGVLNAEVFVDIDNDGDEDALPAGDYGNYTFAWDRGNIITASPLNTTIRILQFLNDGTTPIPADNYTVVAVNTLTSCVASPVTTTLVNPGPLFDIDLNVNLAPASCATNDGVITAFVNDGGPTVVNYTFEWYEGTITNGIQTPPASFYTDPVVSFNGAPLPVDPGGFYGTALYPVGQPLPFHQAPTSATTGPTLYGRASGTYTVVVTSDLTGCKEYETAYLPFLAEPVIVVADVVPDDCLGDNGAVGVDINVPAPRAASDYRIWLIAGSNPPLTPASDPVTPFPPIDPAAASGNLFNNLPAGLYTVVAQEDPADILSGCFSSPVLIELREALPPRLNLSAAIPSTSCGAAPGDGSLEIVFSTDPSDPFSPGFPPPPPPTTYNPAGQSYSVSIEDAGGNPIFASAGNASGDSETIPALKNGDYEVTITSSQGCVITKTYTVPWNPQVVELTAADVVATNALYCDPLLETNARIEVISLSLTNGAAEDIDDYQFEWFGDLALTPPALLSAQGNSTAVEAGEVLENGTSVPAGTVTAGSYWVTVTKLVPGTSGGEGCTSAPYKIDIEDDSEDPSVSFATIADRSCDLVNFDGEITVTATNTAMPGGGYNFDWTTIPAAAGSAVVTDNVNAATTIVTNAPGDIIGSGSYTIRVTNLDTQCFADGTVSVQNNPLAVTLTAQKIADRDVCFTDGQIDVTGVGVGAFADYNFEWRKGSSAGAILDDGTNPINGTTLLGGVGLGEYASMDADNYYVIAEKVTGPGMGCRTAPAVVALLDISENPSVSFATIADRSCDLINFDGEITVTATNTAMPGSGYNFDWTTISAAAGSAVVTDNVNAATTIVTNAVGDIIGAGAYTIRVTNLDTQCFADGTVSVQNNPLVVTLTAQKIADRDVCFTDGQIDVTGVGVGAFADYNFEWRKGSSTGAILDDGTNPINGTTLLGGVGLGEYASMDADNYYVIAEKVTGPGMGCRTAPAVVALLDISENPSVSFATIADRSCDLINFDGEITVTATNTAMPGSGYNFDWTTISAAAGSAVVTDNVNAATTIVTNAPGDIIGAGAYTIRVTNLDTQCFADGTVSVQNNPLVVTLTAQKIADRDVCFTDGQIDVTGVGVGAFADYNFEWRKGSSAGAILDDGTNPINGTTLLGGVGLGEYASMDANNYYVIAEKVTGPGMGCRTAPAVVALLDISENPSVSFATIADRSCDLINFDGEITVTATNTAMPGGGYNFDWTTISAAAGSAVVTDNVNAATTIVTNAAGDIIGSGSYTIRVTNLDTQCFADGTVNVQNNPLAVTVLAQKIGDQEICGPDGRIDVTGVGIGGFADYTYEWRKGNVGGPLLTDNASNAISGLVLQAGTNPGEYPDMEADSYFVLAEKTSAPGMGCRTSAVRVDVLDEREFPVVSLSTTPNTTCNSAYDAEISLEAQSDGIGNGANYDLVWAGPGGTAILASNVPANPYTTSAVDGIGTYTVAVTNLVSQCSTDASVTVLQNTTPVQIWHVEKLDQRDCAPFFDGGITINPNDPDHVSVVGPYTFAWEKTGVALTPVPDNILTGIDAGVYQVVGTKTSGIGAGCTTAPFFVTLLDLTERPVVELQSIANFACDPAFANGEISGIIFEGTAVAPSADYNLQWFAGKNVTSGPVLGTSDVLANQLQGEYTLLAVDNVSPNRGCDNSASMAIDFDETTFSLAVATTDQTLCAPGQDGSVTVTGITEVRNGVSTPAADLTLFGFQWTDETGTQHPSTPGFVNGVTAINNLLAGDYHVEVQNALGCISSATAGVIQDETVLPVINLDSYINPAVCILPETAGYLQVSADNNPNFADYTFEWFEGPADIGPVISGTAELSNVAYNQSLEYTVRVTRNDNHCVSLDTYRFTVETVEVKVLASAVGRRNCVADDGTLFATTLDGTGALYNYEWYTGPTATGVPVYTTKEVTGVPIGQYTVIAVNPNHAFCQSTPYTTRVTDERVLPPVVVVERNPLTYCDPANPNGVAFASVNNEVNGYVFDWFEGAVAGAPLYTGPEVADLRATTYVVRATHVLTGCEQTESIVIGNNPVDVPEPTVVVVSHHTNCVVPDGILAASVNGLTAGYQLQWYDGSSVKSTADGTGEFYRDLEEGLYATTATDNVSGCVSEPVVTEILPFQEKPEFDVTTVPTNCEQDIGEAAVEVTNDVQVSSIVWDISGMQEIGARLSELPKGEFIVTVTTFQQCFDSKAFIIEPEVLVFNGISRNNDGRNDIFEIACIQDFPGNNVKIFNRAGTLVYEADGYDNQDVFFDGVSNRGINLLGTDLPDGTYFYIIDKRNGSKPATGYLELLR